MTSNTNAEGILQYAVDQLVIERDELRVAYQEQVEHNRFAASKHSEHIHELSDRLNELRAENERLRAVVDAARQMIDVGAIDRYQPESYWLVEALAALGNAKEC